MLRLPKSEVKLLFYSFFKEICAAHGTSPSAVALAAGMSKSNVTGWRNGQSPSLETINKLAAQLKVNPKELIPDFITSSVQ